MISTMKQNWNRATFIFLAISIVEIIIQYVRRNETICCLIGFGIGVGCCFLYRLISNLFSSSTNSILPKLNTKQNSLINDKNSTEKCSKIFNDSIRYNNTLSDEMTWSEMSSSLSTYNLLQDSYHSNSLTGDSGVDCPELTNRNYQQYDEENDSLLRKYDQDHFETTTIESNNFSYISTEKGLERALEQTSRFYTDLEHIAIDLGTLTKRYSPSHKSIDALDWDWNDDFDTLLIQSPKSIQRNRSTNRNKIRRRINTNVNQTEYNESDNENRIFDYSTSPLRRKHSSVYFDSTDNTSDDDNLGDETLQINS